MITELVTHARVRSKLRPNGSISIERTSTQTSEDGPQACPPSGPDFGASASAVETGGGGVSGVGGVHAKESAKPHEDGQGGDPVAMSRLRTWVVCPGGV